jgi:hypothetical protein
MRHINNHMKEVMGIKSPPKKRTIKDWNWAGIIVWAIILSISFSLVQFIYNLIF